MSTMVNAVAVTAEEGSRDVVRVVVITDHTVGIKNTIIRAGFKHQKHCSISKDRTIWYN